MSKSKTKLIDLREARKSERVLVVCPDIKVEAYKSDKSIEFRLEEAIGLVQAIDLEIADAFSVSVPKIKAGTLLSKGAIDTVLEGVEEHEPDVVYIDTALSPVQQRNLEKEFKTKVIDRTGLILEIFGARARTKEGKLQVELAALSYQRSRLVRSWTHLERQRGGAGFMGGPGETQIEIDRRIIGDRITQIKKEIDQIKKNRDLQRRSRERVPFPIIALVGYTNAGKSTLFNILTDSKIFAEDLLFATLDTTMRKLTLPNGEDVILSDTVGFISDLPTHLVAAFRATLEQVEYADVILHVQDVSDPAHGQQKEDVDKILKDLGVDPENAKHIIEVYNKIDCLAPDDIEDYLAYTEKKKSKAAISAIEGTGLNALKEKIEYMLQRKKTRCVVDIALQDGKTRSWLYKNMEIIGENVYDDKNLIRLTALTDKTALGQFRQTFKKYKVYEYDQT